MQFLAVTRRRTESFSDAEFEERIEAERQQARMLYVENTLRQIWHRADVGGAVLMFEADSEAEARRAIEQLPLHQAGMLELVMLIPLKPYGGFGPRD